MHARIRERNHSITIRVYCNDSCPWAGDLRVGPEQDHRHRDKGSDSDNDSKALAHDSFVLAGNATTSIKQWLVHPKPLTYSIMSVRVSCLP